ncbi:acyl-CoA dehydrogenase C-terminal domain-containing protein [Hirschia maritima]|uniref:acyl-CoA dehydrogenase C-terminal domain-containing protein n=1 Tax=Hirschia maritima TaxID=1121961 RepID=UPI00037A4EC7|nr:acyl-CoA dehydrogenase C-terminal domain-containing protein [Hirschia maritima]
MPRYDAPVRDMRFILNEVLDINSYNNLSGFSELSEDLVDAILNEGAKFAKEVLHPLNMVGDQQGVVRHSDGSVKTPDGFPEAYKAMAEGGWTGLSADTEFGGQGLPHVLDSAISEMMSSANMAFAMYPGLTHGAYSAILAGASQEQKETYVPKMVSGEWAGTMNLTEPHCGTDLGLMKTKAVPQADGTYKISGQKIWISGGENDFTDNIIHLVLAKIEGAPEGIKGVSLFIVPKFVLDEDGNPGERNACGCGGLEEKMGIHGNATCVMNYDGATGYLVGEPNKGMRTMFVMMNAARLGVGVQGLAQSEISYQNAVDFAKDRLQSRSVSGPKAPEKVADPVIVHPDVRRMLMDQKAFNEGARAFSLWTSLYNDLEHRAEDEKTREKASDYMGLLTPVVKAFLTDKGLKGCIDAMQIHGGSGFTKEWGMEQFVRDCRIALIYEGTNGVQALDLVGRKLPSKGGRAIMTFNAEMDAFIAENDTEEMKLFIDALKITKGQLQEATMWLMQNGMTNPDNAAAASHDFLHIFGYTTFAYMWARMAKVALAKKDSGDDFYTEKLATGRYFVERMLPDVAAHLVKVKTGAEPLFLLDEAQF